ncbi:MAG: hypothetical protein JXQ65_07310 [Candidatus Marinimicrobia bacterium]|nr:hypothetical protein [Candidatus Neomarinimicrobiota bacterium]
MNGNNQFPPPYSTIYILFQKPEQKSVPKSFLQENRSNFIALGSLICIWVLYRAYLHERKNKTIALSFDDLAVLKRGRDVMNMIWEKVNPKKNIIKLDDYKK